VPDEDIFACCSALSFLDEKGFRYYIPAFMLCSLRHWGDEASVILNSREYHLLHDYPKSLRASEPALIAGKYQFTEAQSRAVARFLRFVLISMKCRQIEPPLKLWSGGRGMRGRIVSAMLASNIGMQRIRASAFLSC
jgi:hypothetical protein